MFCPQCEGEYREGFTECADCGVALVAELPKAAAPMPDGDLVRVYETADAGLIPVIESVLDAAGIAVMTKGEQVQDMFAWGRLLGKNPAVGPVEFFVRPDQEAAARQALQELGEPLPEDEEPPGA